MGTLQTEMGNVQISQIKYYTSLHSEYIKCDLELTKLTHYAKCNKKHGAY